MRFYQITLTNPTSGATVRQWSTWVNGQNDPGALDVEFDISVTAFATPDTNSSFLRIWGISLKDVSQASNLSKMNISIIGGMKPGLPLATAQAPQAGLLAQGTVFPAYGNWVGIDMTLDMQLVPFQSPLPDGPTNIVIDWKAGIPLATALKNTLATAFPGFTQNINISPNLVTSYDQPGFYGNLWAFSPWLKQKTKAILGGTYAGVDLVATGKTINVYDRTVPAKKIVNIQFQDMIGQPTWITPTDVQVKVVLRGDVNIADDVTLPATPVTTTAASATPAAGVLSKNISSFQGTFQVVSIRHVGHLRQPDGNSWATIIDAVPMAASAT